jgi:hypothetical protein
MRRERCPGLLVAQTRIETVYGFLLLSVGLMWWLMEVPDLSMFDSIGAVLGMEAG